MSEAIDVAHNEAKHRFEIVLDGEEAFAEYRIVDDRIVLPHTVVPEAFEGRGFGSKLAKAALGYAREERLTVIPTCPFIAAYITKHPEWHDLVDDDYRARLGID